MELVYRTMFNVAAYSRLRDQQRARMVYMTTYSLVAIFTIYALAVPFRTTLNLDYQTYFYRALRPAQFPIFTFALVGFYVVALITLAGIRIGRLGAVTLLPAAMIYVGATLIAIQGNMLHAQNTMILLVAVLVAGLLDGERGLLVFVPLYFIVITASFVITYNDAVLHSLPTNTSSTFVLFLVTSAVASSLIFAYQRALRRDQVETQILATRRRRQLAQLTTRIARSMSEVDDLDKALNSIVVDVMRDFPDMYHVQIFLNDEEGRLAKLVASTGSVGQVLLERNHSLLVGSLSVIGQVSQRGEPVVAVVGQEDSVHRPNDLLPNTSLEVALPLNVGSRNIGALDLQSKVVTEINEGDLIALQAIADSLALAIYNTRLLEEAQTRLLENQQLMEQMRDSQTQVELLNRELTGVIWSDYLRNKRDTMNFDLDISDGEPLKQSSDLTASIQEAIKTRDIVRRIDDSGQVITVPLRVRGEVIGALEFEVGDDLSGEDIEMLNEVGERLGLAAENNRLYENSQLLAQRQALVNEIGTRIQVANTVEATINEAAKSLRDVLKAKRVAIQLGTTTPRQSDKPTT